jgi:DNA invertase Pin-like site-specific DNA recombinase
VKQYVLEHYDGAVEWHIITSRDSGEYLDREELVRLEALIESGTVDVVICEDLARICRRTRAYDLCELAVDNTVRLIALNDHVDTSRDDWHLNAFFPFLDTKVTTVIRPPASAGRNGTVF